MKQYLLLFLLAGTLIMIVVMSKTGAPLKTLATPKGILDLEFAYSTAKTAIVINAWQPTIPETFGKIEAAKFNTYLDFIFIFFYSLFLFFTCKKIARLSSSFFSKAGNAFAKGALVAAILDVLENTGMLITLYGNGSGTVALFTTACSVIKWLLALLAVAYCLAGLIYLTGNKKIKLLLA